MSFIFDALKKAESERSRQSGPVLMDVRIAPRRHHLPGWAWWLGCVLLANLLLLAWLVFRPDANPDAVTTSTAPVTSAPVAAPAPVALPPAAPPAEMQPVAPAGTAALVTAPPPATSNLPTMQELIASGVALPALQLNLHVYDEVAGNRYVLLNSKRLREGDSLPDGIRVERITAEGVVLNAAGRRFLLIAGG